MRQSNAIKVISGKYILTDFHMPTWELGPHSPVWGNLGVSKEQVGAAEPEFMCINMPHRDFPNVVWALCFQP